LYLQFSEAQKQQPMTQKATISQAVYYNILTFLLYASLIEIRRKSWCLIYAYKRYGYGPKKVNQQPH
jgi:hypothetical protein